VQILNYPQTDRQKESEVNYRIALVILCAIINFYGLGYLPFIGPDEPRYTQVAREMLDTRDWITPRLGGINWFEKPALTYWISALGYKLFGVSEFAARFGVAVVASIGVLMLYLFGRRIRSSLFGYLSASVLVTCGLWPGFARGATFDLPLGVASELALLSFYLWESRGERAGKNGLWWVFWFALGLAVLAKGLVGIIVPLVVIGPYLLVMKRWRIVFKPGLLLPGMLLFLATAATWYVPVIARHGQDFIGEFFIAHHFRRYLTNEFRHPQPFYFFWLVAFAGSFPWSLYLASNAWHWFKRLRTRFDREHDRLGVFLWLWVLAPIVFFSFSGSKLPGYILPIFPAIALIIGSELEKWWSDKESEQMRLAAISTAILIFIVALGIGLRGKRELGLELFDAWKVATIGIIIAIVYLALWFLLSGRAATIFLPFGLALAVVVSANLIFPALGRSESLRDLSLLARQAARPGEHLVFYINHDHGINFYATELPLRDQRSELITVKSLEELESLILARGDKSILVASPRRWVNGINEMSPVTIEPLGEQKRNLGCSPDCDWVLFRAYPKS
jgi:4-amino-4-deoxy-L-arabinose transferase-like glycosyltransferase